MKYYKVAVASKGVVVAQGDTYEAALANVTSAIRFHIETFGPEAFEEDSPVSWNGSWSGPASPNNRFFSPPSPFTRFDVRSLGSD